MIMKPHELPSKTLVAILVNLLQFLSMKLATVNPQLDFNNLPNLLAKDVRTNHLYACSHCHIRLLLSD